MESIITTLQETALGFWKSITEYFPKIVGALIVLIAGSIIANLVSKAVFKLLKTLKVDELTEKLGLDELILKMGIKGGVSGVIARIVKWIILLIIIVTATEVLGMQMLTDFVTSVINFLPKLFSAILIFAVGYVIAKRIYTFVLNMTNSLGSGAGKLIAGALYYFILILISITALNQTGIDTSLISNNLILMIGVLLLAGGLAYAYAARDIMRNMLSSFFGKSNFREGQRIRLDTIEGTILKIDKISVTIDSDGKKVVIPSAELLNNRVVIIEDARTTKS